MSPDAIDTRLVPPDVLPCEPRKGDAYGVGRSGALSEIHIHTPGRYIVELSPTERRMPFLRLNVRRPGHPDRVVYVPVTGQTSYLLKSTERGVVLQFEKRDVVASTIRRLRINDLNTVLRCRRRQKHFELFLGQGIVLRPLLHIAGSEGRDLTHSLKSLAAWGFGVASANLQGTLSRHFDGPSIRPPDRAPIAEPKIAVALHLHYPELWPEFEVLLEAIGRPFHLILTLTRPDVALAQRVQARFRNAEIIVYDNRGRDVGPFVQLLREGKFDPFDLICKLHGKKSDLSGPRKILGEVWRRASAFDLIGSRDVVDRIIAEFERSPDTQMIGSRRFRLPNEWKGEKAAWGENNRAMILNLLETMGMAPDSPLDFFAGTMFWVRRSALRPLKQLDLSLASFPDETGQQDGTLHHALERILGMICTKISGTAWDDENTA
ncbi:rhamnan synthesis F family protein [Mesorhizobium sp. NZP2298]|uniref:rhamnan synthesis F family protein n=1 Tax=Mesorhizobium sp. NZP2298 TaxID=2483403 RepID=UPI001556ADD4|nr:rhamnan synthesis F family protein [Mesorhizobium sp. NZP2298]QKC93901.1 rhamnan synthesis F [Mesorhizobium sp. NZP2298]